MITYSYVYLAQVHFRTPDITYPDQLLPYHTRNLCLSDIALCYFSYNSELQYSWTAPHDLVYKL